MKRSLKTGELWKQNPDVLSIGRSSVSANEVRENYDKSMYT